MKFPKTKKAYHKRAEFLKELEGNQTLQSILTDILYSDDGKRVSYRMIEFKNKTWWINYRCPLHNDNGEGLCIELFCYNMNGDENALISLNTDEEELPVESLSVENHKALLEGSFYAFISGDDLITISLKGFNHDNFETYLNALLWRGTNSDDYKVAISDCLPAPSFIDAQAVNEMKISAPIGDAKKLQVPDNDGLQLASDEIKQAEYKISKENVKEKWELIKGLIKSLTKGKVNDIPDFDSLSADQIQEAALLDLGIQLKWKNRRDDRPDDLLSRVSRALRHADVDDNIDYSVRTKDGEFKKDKLKTHKSIACLWEDGRPDLESIFPKMLEWLAQRFSQRE